MLRRLGFGYYQMMLGRPGRLGFGYYQMVLRQGWPGRQQAMLVMRVGVLVRLMAGSVMASVSLNTPTRTRRWNSAQLVEGRAIFGDVFPYNMYNVFPPVTTKPQTEVSQSLFTNRALATEVFQS